MSAFSTSSPADGVTLVTFPEQVLGGPEAVELATIVREAIAADQKVIAFDLSGVAIMNSSGLGMLVASLTTTRGKDAELRLAAIPEKVASLLKMTQLDKIFTVSATVEEAVAP